MRTSWPYVRRPMRSSARSCPTRRLNVPGLLRIVATIRSSPGTFNRLVGQERALDLIGRLTYGQLVRINRATWDVEPWLAESWTRSDDGLRYTLKLRPHVTFSDGHAFTADDVVFSFAALYDERTASPISETVRVGGKP